MSPGVSLAAVHEDVLKLSDPHEINILIVFAAASANKSNT